MKNNRIETALHLAFWIASAWLLTGSFSVVMHEINIENGVEKVNIVRSNGLMIQILSCIVLSVLMFYLTSWYLLRKSEMTRQVLITLVWLLACSLLLTYTIISIHRRFCRLPLPNQIAYGIVIFYFTVSIAYSAAKLWHRNQQKQQLLLLNKQQAELALLRRQLQPHFLFNALNNLLSMVDPEMNPKLAGSFERLSQLLRYVIDESQLDKVSLEKEIIFLKNYIELQLLRFNDNEVRVLFEVEGNFTDQPVEPGLFIVFVENAFKYGTEPEHPSFINIHFDLTKKDTIRFEIENEVLMRDADSNRTGIESIQKRLKLIYPDKHELTIEARENYSTRLLITTL